MKQGYYAMMKESQLSWNDDHLNFKHYPVDDINVD
jgi:hypothetical protein